MLMLTLFAIGGIQLMAGNFWEGAVLIASGLVCFVMSAVGDWTANKMARTMVKEANDELDLNLRDWTDAELARLDAELNGE